MYFSIKKQIPAIAAGAGGLPDTAPRPKVVSFVCVELCRHPPTPHPDLV